MIAAVLVSGGAAFAQTADLDCKVKQIVSGNDEAVPDVAPGEEIAIACEALDYTAPDNRRARGADRIGRARRRDTHGLQESSGDRRELVTGAVRVKIPNVPDLENHTVDLERLCRQCTRLRRLQRRTDEDRIGLKKPKPNRRTKSKSETASPPPAYPNRAAAAIQTRPGHGACAALCASAIWRTVSG